MLKKRPAYKNFIKSDLINALSRKHRTTKMLAEMAVETVLSSITKSLKEGRRVEVRGFGTFEIRKYGAYQGRNPQTGKEIYVPPKKLPFFRAGKFKELLKKKSRH